MIIKNRVCGGETAMQTEEKTLYQLDGVIKTFRAMQFSDSELLRMLCGIQDGTICFSDVVNNNISTGTEEAAEIPPRSFRQL